MVDNLLSRLIEHVASATPLPLVLDCTSQVDLLRLPGTLLQFVVVLHHSLEQSGLHRPSLLLPLQLVQLVSSTDGHHSLGLRHPLSTFGYDPIRVAQTLVQPHLNTKGIRLDVGNRLVRSVPLQSVVQDSLIPSVNLKSIVFIDRRDIRKDVVWQINLLCAWFAHQSRQLIEPILLIHLTLEYDLLMLHLLHGWRVIVLLQLNSVYLSQSWSVLDTVSYRDCLWSHINLPLKQGIGLEGEVRQRLFFSSRRIRLNCFLDRLLWLYNLCLRWRLNNLSLLNRLWLSDGQLNFWHGFFKAILDRNWLSLPLD